MANNEQGQDTKFPVKYGIQARFLDTDHPDVSSFVAVRCPITKTASFALLTVNMKVTQYMALEHSIRQNKFELVQVTFDIRANYSTVDSINPPKIDDMGQKQYLALHIEPYENPQPWSPYTIATIYLVNPVLYYLQVTNSFNQILENITSYDVLLKFEQHLSSAYGSKAFQWQKVGETFEQNKWKFEQVLCRQNNDLMIPTYLINSYKMWHTYGYYFFDDFRFDDESKADITGWLINLGDIQQFKQRNIFETKRTEMFAANMFEKTQTLADRFNSLYQDKPSLIVKGYDMQFGYRKAKGTKDVIQISTKTENSSYSNVVNGAKIVTSDVSTKAFEPTEQTLIYAPDDIELGIKRFDKVSAQLREKLHSIETYYIHDSHLDFIQFGYKYNISPYDINDYSYVPISICNLFIRESGRVPIFTHNLKYQLFKYKYSTGSGGKLSGGNFKDYPVN